MSIAERLLENGAQIDLPDSKVFYLSIQQVSEMIFTLKPLQDPLEAARIFAESAEDARIHDLLSNYRVSVKSARTGENK